MKFKAFLTTLTVAITALFAQAPVDTADFNVVHGNSYSYISNTNELAYYNNIYAFAIPSIAPTVNGLINAPYRMYGRNFVYIEPSNRLGVASYTSNEKTTFLSIETNGNSRGRGTLGIATKAVGFSFTLDIDDHLEFYEEKSPYYKREIDTYGASTWNTYQLRLAFPIGSLDLNTRFMFTRTNATDSLYSATYKDHDGKTEKTFDTHHFTLWGEAILSNTPSARNFFWRTELSVMRYNHSIDSSYTNSEDHDEDYDVTDANAKNNTTYFDIAYAFGVIALKAPRARVHIGAVSRAEARLKDFLEDKENRRKDSYLKGYLYFTPSIWAEYSFSDNWMVWAASAFTWDVEGTGEKYTDQYKTKNQSKSTLIDVETTTNAPMLKTGARFSYKNIVLEASVGTAFFSNPFRGFDNSAFLSSLCGFVTF